MSEQRLGLFKFPTSVSKVVKTEISKLTYSGQIMLGDGVPELTWSNMPQAEPYLTTKFNQL